MSGTVPLLPLYASMDSKGIALLLALMWMFPLRQNFTVTLTPRYRKRGYLASVTVVP